MLFCSCKGWNKEREYRRRSSEFNRLRRVCVCKTNKPLQSRTSYSGIDHRVLTKTLLYQNDASFSKDVIFHTRQAGRQAANPTNIHPESKASGIKRSLCSSLLLDPGIPPTTPFVSPDSFIRGGVASFLRSARAAGDRFILVPLRGWMAGLSMWWQVDCRW